MLVSARLRARGGGRVRAARYFHPSPRGEGGPRQAFSPAVAGRGPHVLLVVGMRGHFRRFDHRLPATHNRGLGVSRQLTPSVLSRGGSEPIWFRLNIHVAPLCGVNSGSSNDPFRTSLDAQPFHGYGLSYAREEDRSR